MSKTGKDYVVVVQAPAIGLGGGRFATESAFAIHLKALRADLGADFARLVVVAPQMQKSIYEKNLNSFGCITEDADGIVFVPAHENGVSPGQFWTKELIPFWKRLTVVLSSAGYVQTGLASDIKVPYLAVVNARVWLKRIPSTFIIDIDFRQMSRRFYRTGVWSRKSYLVNRLIHDPFKKLQVWLAVRASNLALLKSPSMVADYGAGRPHVKDFLDAAHSAREVVTHELLENRLAARAEKSRPLEVVYFGRFVPYKGLDLALDAVEHAIRRGANIRLTFIGSGECLDSLRRRAETPELRDAVTFVAPVPYGDQLFDLIDGADVTIAAPKTEDTPRAALDSMARGLPIVAFDIDYFKNLADKSGAVALAEWPSPESLADRLVELDNDRSSVAKMARHAVVFAQANTQEIWLKRRTEWTQAAYSAGRS